MGVIKSGWFQPAIFSRAALEVLAPASRKHAMSRVCAAYSVTHDVGMGVLLWQLGIFVGNVRKIALHNTALPAKFGMLASKFGPHIAMVHGVRSDDKHANFSLVHALAVKLGDDSPPGDAANAAARIVSTHLDRLAGFEQTRFAEEHNNHAASSESSLFDFFSPADCAVEANARLVAKGEPERSCWCDAQMGPYPKDDPECKQHCKQHRVLSAHANLQNRQEAERICGHKAWCLKRVAAAQDATRSPGDAQPEY